VTITGTNIDPVTHVAGLGLDSFDIYWAADGAPFTFYGNVSAGSPDLAGQYSVTASISGSSNHAYSFYVRARDKGGNVELKPAVSETTTYVNDFDAPVTQVVSAVNNNSPTYLVSWTGADAPGGVGLKTVDLYVSVDGGTPSLFQSVLVSSGQTGGTASYQVNEDGGLHSYRFFSIGTDRRSNQESDPGGSSDLVKTYQTSAPPALAFTSLLVNGGLTNRSYIRTVDLMLTRTMTSAEFAAATVTLKQHDVNGGGAGTPINLAGHLNLVDHAIEIDFGAAVLDRDGNAAKNLADGVYEIAFDLHDGHGAQTQYFYRLLGDTNNDLKVDQTDINNITIALPNPTTSPNADINGDGRVNSTDKALATRYKDKSKITFAPLTPP
jgi:hypothetical protein